MKVLNVAHIASQLEMGGMEKLLVEFARHADRERFNLAFVSLGQRGRLADEIEALGWPVHAMQHPTGLRPALLVRLAPLFRRLRIDVVHSHGQRPLVYGAPAARLARVRRVIHTRHGQAFNASSRATKLFRTATLLADRVVCVSRDSARLTAEVGVRPERICTVINGVDVGRFSYTGPQTGGPVVTVARLSPEKGVETLVRAAALLTRQDDRTRFEVAGSGVCADSLRALAVELGVGERLGFLGELNDIPALLGRASLFVLPSLTEGIPLTILEAMGRGLPVVATRVGGNAEVVVDGETGYLVPSDSPAELAGAIQRIVDDPELGRRMGAAGRRRAEERFDVRRMVAEYESLYLGNPPRTAPIAGPGRGAQTDSPFVAATAAVHANDAGERGAQCERSSEDA